MSERDDYDDAPRPSWQPTLSERAPAPDVKPADRDSSERPLRTPATAWLAFALAGLSPVAGRIISDLTGLDRLERPWPLLIGTVTTWGLFCMFMTLGWRQIRKANQSP